jgi:hypothetical protein
MYPQRPGRADDARHSADQEAFEVTTQLRDGFDPHHLIAIALHLAALLTTVGQRYTGHAAARFAHDADGAFLLRLASRERTCESDS